MSYTDLFTMFGQGFQLSPDPVLHGFSGSYQEVNHLSSQLSFQEV
jgi:hypothetical protein